MLLYF